MQQYNQNNFQEEQQNKLQVISKLSDDLQENLKREQYKDIIPKIHTLFNKKINIKALQDLTLYFEEEFYLPDQKLKFENNYLLCKLQKVEIYDCKLEKENVKNFCNKKKLGIGQIFGIIDFITGISSNHIVKSSKFTQIVKINRTDFISIIKQSELEYQKFCEIRDKILFYSNLYDLNISCKFCDSHFHQDLNCNQVNVDKKSNYYKQRVNQQETQSRVCYQRKKIKNINPLYIQFIINQHAQVLIGDFKKEKNFDFLEQLNITLSESEATSSDQNTENQDQSQKEIEFQKSSLNNISNKNDIPLRNQSIFAKNKQSIKELEVKKYVYSYFLLNINEFNLKQDHQKEGDSNTASFQEQSIDKLNLNGIETLQNSLTMVSENQRVTFKDIDKINKEIAESRKLSEERVDSQNAINPNRKLLYQAPRKSIKNASQKFISRLSCYYDNQDNNQKENLKQSINKLVDNFKLLNQAINNSYNQRKNSIYNFNQIQEFKKIVINLKNIAQVK